MKFFKILLAALVAATASGQSIEYVRVYDSVADMAARANPLSLHRTVRTRGHTTIMDGAGSMYFATNAVTGTNTVTRIASLVVSGWSFDLVYRTNYVIRAGTNTFTWPLDHGSGGQVLSDDGTGVLSWVTGGGGGGGGYATIQEEGVGLTARTILNFAGSALTAADDGGTKTTVTVDADVNGIADLASNGMVARTGGGTFAARTVTGTTQEIAVTDGGGASGNPTLGLVTNVLARANQVWYNQTNHTGTNYVFSANVREHFVTPAADFDFYLTNSAAGATNGTLYVTVVNATGGTIYGTNVVAGTAVYSVSDWGTFKATSTNLLILDKINGAWRVSQDTGQINALQVGNGTVTNDEFSYIAGLTSDAQTQLDAKVDESSGTALNLVATTPTLISPTVSGAVTFPDGVRQIFNPDGTTPGLNVGQHASDPSGLANADVVYNSTTHKYRVAENGVVTSLLTILGIDTSAELAAIVTDELGSGSLVFASGTPDGTKFVRDDGVLAVPPGGSSPTTTQGDIIVRGSAVDERFGIGRLDQVATVASDGVSFVYKNPPLVDEFLSASAASSWNWTGVTANGGSVSAGVAPPDTGHFGAMALNTSAATNGLGGIRVANVNGVFSSSNLMFKASIKTPALSTDADVYRLWIGFGDSTAGADPVDGAYFEYQHTSSLNWLGKTSNNSSRTTASGGSNVTVNANTWYILRIEGNSTTVTFYVSADDGITWTNIGSSASNIPLATGREFGIQILISKEGGSVGTTSRSLYLDRTTLQF